MEVPKTCILNHMIKLRQECIKNIMENLKVYEYKSTKFVS